MVGIRGDAERGAIRQGTAAARNGEFADVQQLLLELDLGHTPGVRLQVTGGFMNQMLGKAVSLLKLLHPQEHALRPYDAVAVLHRQRVRFAGSFTGICGS